MGKNEFGLFLVPLARLIHRERSVTYPHPAAVCGAIKHSFDVPSHFPPVIFFPPVFLVFCLFPEKKKKTKLAK
jgi:hypothetical protein